MNNQDQKNKNIKEQIPEEEKVTITPTMIDESEERIEKKRDLSAIIPKFEDMSENNESVELISQEKALKGDGAIAIALINGDGEVSLTSNAAFPEQIDIEERKKAKQKGNTKKVKKKKKSKTSQRMQNRTALGSLIVIIFLAGFWYWYKNHPTEKDFQPLEVTVQIGESLPIRKSSYVKPGVGTLDDELEYALDLSNVVLEEVGEYEFTVTYKGIKKTGIINIVDEEPPELEVRNVEINEGDTYDASSFVESCKDPSGCNYSFQDTETEKKYTTNGVYVVYVVATDAFQNSVTKKASLIIEAKGNLKTFSKSTSFDFSTGYELVEKYNLRFEDYSNYSLLLNGTHEKVFKYHDEEVYDKAAKTYSGEVNYICDDSKRTITYREVVTTVGSNYSRLEEIEPYLLREGFTEE